MYFHSRPVQRTSLRVYLVQKVSVLKATAISLNLTLDHRKKQFLLF